TLRPVERLGRLRIVDRDRTVGLDDLAATIRLDPFERVAGQSFIGIALPDEAPDVLRTGLALLVLDLLRGHRELVPGLWRLLAVFLEQVLTVVERRRVGEERHGDELAVHGLRFDD